MRSREETLGLPDNLINDFNFKSLSIQNHNASSTPSFPRFSSDSLESSSSVVVSRDETCNLEVPLVEPTIVLPRVTCRYIASLSLVPVCLLRRKACYVCASSSSALFSQCRHCPTHPLLFQLFFIVISLKFSLIRKEKLMSGYQRFTSQG